MAKEERFNVGVLTISEMPSDPGVRTIETPIKDTYHTSVLFTVETMNANYHVIQNSGKNPYNGYVRGIMHDMLSNPDQYS